MLKLTGMLQLLQKGSIFQHRDYCSLASSWSLNGLISLL